MGGVRVRAVALSAAAAAALVSLIGAPAARAAEPPPSDAPDSAPAIVSTTGWYSPDDPNTVTLYEPDGPGPYPALIFVHGGAWGRSQPNEYELQWAHDLAAGEGWLVAVIGYPTKVRDAHVAEPRAIALAIDAIAQRAEVDRHAVALWGESAGAQLALVAAYRDAARLNPVVAGVVSISGPTDMETEYASLAQTALGAVTRFEGLTPAQARRAKSARYRTTSPVHLVGPGSPATFQAISRGDRLVPAGQVDRLTRLLVAAGVMHSTVRLPGKAHSTGLESRRPPGSPDTVQQLAVAFLNRVFTARRVSFD
jgi:acetyl esterase/lipase